jgi:Leucine-rich repeat (LRR) protein
VYESGAHFDLSNNRLTAMPACAVKKPHIKRLDLHHNSIAFVPDTINKLSCLTHLDLSYNSLDELPAQVTWNHVNLPIFNRDETGESNVMGLQAH